MLKSLKIKTRFLLGFGVAIILTAIVGLIGFTATQRLSATIETVDKNGVQALQSLSEMQNALWQLRFGISQYIAVPTPESRQKIIADSPKWFEAMDRGLKRFGSVDPTQEARAAFVALNDIYSQYKAKRPGWFELMEAGKLEEAADYRAKTILVSGAGTVKALSTLTDIQAQAIADIEKSANTLVISTAAWIVVVTLISLVLAALTGYWIVRDLLKQLGGEPSYAVEVTRNVADEVRKLAEHTTQSTQEIASMIDSIHKNTRQAVINMQGTSDDVTKGAMFARRAGQAMGEIRQGADKVVSAVGEISDTLRELAAAGNQIAGDVEKIAQMTEQNHSSVQEVYRATTELSELASSLQKDAQFFKM